MEIVNTILWHAVKFGGLIPIVSYHKLLKNRYMNKVFKIITIHIWCNVQHLNASEVQSRAIDDFTCKSNLM
jgi:hypothetical protein